MPRILENVFKSHTTAIHITLYFRSQQEVSKRVETIIPISNFPLRQIVFQESICTMIVIQGSQQSCGPYAVPRPYFFFLSWHEMGLKQGSFVTEVNCRAFTTPFSHIPASQSTKIFTSLIIYVWGSANRFNYSPVELVLSIRQ